MKNSPLVYKTIIGGRQRFSSYYSFRKTGQLAITSGKLNLNPYYFQQTSFIPGLISYVEVERTN